MPHFQCSYGFNFRRRSGKSTKSHDDVLRDDLLLLRICDTKITPELFLFLFSLLSSVQKSSSHASEQDQDQQPSSKRGVVRALCSQIGLEANHLKLDMIGGCEEETNE